MKVQKKANKISKEIKYMERQLEGTHSEGMVKELQNELATKEAEIESLSTEIAGFKSVKKQQQKALNGLEAEGANDEYVSKYKEAVANSKQEFRQISEEYKQHDKQLKQRHQEMIELEEKWRAMEKLIKASKGGKKKQKGTIESKSTITIDDEIEYLQNEIEELEKAENFELEQKKKILANIETQKQELSHSVGMLSLQIKEKDQEEKLNDLKAKELKRTLPHGQLKPLRRNQSQSSRKSKHNSSMVNSRVSGNSSRNASASRIPTIRTKKKKNLRMNMSVDAVPNTDKPPKAKVDKKLLNSSDDDMPSESKMKVVEEMSENEVKQRFNPEVYKGYTPTGMPIGKYSKLPPTK